MFDLMFFFRAVSILLTGNALGMGDGDAGGSIDPFG